MGSGLMTGGFDGWLGPSPGGGGGGGGVVLVSPGVGIAVDNTDPTNPIVSNTGVLSVTGIDGITVDNTDPQNPIVKLTDFPLITGYLSELYAQGVADNPVADNTLVGSYFDTYFDTDGHVRIGQNAPSTGADSDANPALVQFRWFNVNWPAYGLWGEYDTRYDQWDGSNYKGGGQFRYYNTDSTGTRRLFGVNQVVQDRQIVASGYTPAIAPDGAVTSFYNWIITNRFDDASFLFWNADGVHYKDALFPNGGPYTLFSHQTNMWGNANVGHAPEAGSALIYASVSIGKHTGPGDRVGMRESFVMDDVTNESGHMEVWVRSGPAVASRTLSVYQFKTQWDAATTTSLSDANTGAVAYDGTLDRLQLSNNAGAYSPILTAADIGPSTGSIVTDIVSAEQDFETATTFTVVPNSAGRTFLPIAAYVEFTDVDTLATGPTLKLGNNVAHDNVAPALAVANTVVTDSAPPFVMASDVVIIDLNATGIICELTVNAAATTCLGRVHVIGVYTT